MRMDAAAGCWNRDTSSSVTDRDKQRIDIRFPIVKPSRFRTRQNS